MHTSTCGRRRSSRRVSTRQHPDHVPHGNDGAYHAYGLGQMHCFETLRPALCDSCASHLDVYMLALRFPFGHYHARLIPKLADKHEIVWRLSLAKPTPTPHRTALFPHDRLPQPHKHTITEAWQGLRVIVVPPFHRPWTLRRSLTRTRRTPRSWWWEWGLRMDST